MTGRKELTFDLKPHLNLEGGSTEGPNAQDEATQ